MELPNILLTKEDFDKACWEDVIRLSKKKECFAYSELFSKKAEEARKNSDTKNEAVFVLLSLVTFFYFTPESAEEPFVSMFQVRGSRSLIPDDLKKEQLDSLKELSMSSDPEIAARITDVLWVRNRDHKMAELAVEYYLKSATALEDITSWSVGADRIERALRLAMLLRNKILISRVADHIEKTIKKYNTTDSSFLSAKMMELLLEIKMGSPQDYIEISERLASKGEGEYDWHRARTYLDLKARWHALSGDSENQRATLIRTAETYVKEAEDATKNSTPSFFAASTHLQKGIEAFRRLGDQKEKVQGLHKTLLSYQEKIAPEMREFSQERDFSQVIESSRSKVENKPFEEAIKRLALMCRSPRVADLEKRVKGLMKRHPLLFLVSKVGIDRNGKTIARRPSARVGDPEEDTAATRAEMYEQAATIDVSILDQTIIEPAREQIAFEHRGTIYDFLPIVSNHPFVPPGREFLYAKGLSAGLKGEFVEFANIILPQIENSIRYLLYQRGIPTSSLDPEGIQKEEDLNKLLYLPEVKKIFGEDITFDLQGLFVEQSGTNLRNRQAHGLLDFRDFFSSSVSYAWWLVLHILFLIIMVAEQSQKNELEK